MGFSAIYVALLIVIVGLVGATGWYVLKSNKHDSNGSAASYDTGQSSSQNSTLTGKEKTKGSTPKPSVTEKLSDNWLIRESAEASIKVPDGFNILVNGNHPVNFLLSNDQGELKYEPGTRARVVGENHKHFGLGLIVTYGSAKEEDVDPNPGTLQRNFKTYDGLDVEVRVFEQNDPEAVTTLPYGSTWLKYWVKKGDRYFYVGYIYKGDGIIEVIDEMAKTIVIK